MHQDNQYQNHIPVLLPEVLQYLEPKQGETYLDLTVGYGGHAQAVLAQTGNVEGAVLVDRDQAAITRLGEWLQQYTSEPTVLHEDFYAASKHLQEQGKQFDLILADLGVSSPHLNQASRGFSFKADGPLDMRMDQRQALTAEKVVNTFEADVLADIIQRYGEDPRARKIASLIVHNRPITTTGQLATIVAKAWPGYSKVHPATRTFQAIRIAVNDELELLRLSLPIWLDNLLAPKGRIAIISFHSLEDRIVKQAFAERSGERYDASMTVLTKKPVVGNKNEIVLNPRARSAKLRAAAKQT